MSGEKSVPQEEAIAQPQEIGEVEPQVATPEETEPTLKEVLQAAQAQAAENYDRYLRAAAELDNYRKRTARMRMETREEVLRDVLLQIAPILDNLNRALAQENLEAQGFRQGVELICGQFKEVLQRYGLEEIQAMGQPFDPNLHEALMEIDSQEHPPGSIVQEMEKGYTLNKKVVRPSRVVVNKAGA